MLIKYIGLLYLFISKVSSRIGTSLKGRKGIPLSLLPPPFLPLLSPFILSTFPSLLICHPSFPVFPLSHPYNMPLFHLPLHSPFFESLSPSFLSLPLPPFISPPTLFLFRSISFSTLFACSHLISSHCLLSPHLDHFPPLFSLFLPPFFSPLSHPISLLPNLLHTHCLLPPYFFSLSSLPSQRPFSLAKVVLPGTPFLRPSQYHRTFLDSGQYRKYSMFEAMQTEWKAFLGIE